MNTSAPASASSAVPAEGVQVRALLRVHRLPRAAQVVAAEVDGAGPEVAADDRREQAPRPSSMSVVATPAAPTPVRTTRTSAARFPTSCSAFQERRRDHDRSAVLVVVEDRDVEPLLEPALDLEAAWGRDVLEVDPAEAGRGSPRRRRRLISIRVGRREADRPGIDAAELLEQHRLALHHGHRRLGADVSESEHRGPICDHGDRVLLGNRRGSTPCLRVLGDGRVQTRATPGV